MITYALIGGATWVVLSVLLAFALGRFIHGPR